MATATFTMVDGVRVVATDSLHLITPYVLREQLDWFEDEIRFVRILMRPGDRAIDIGANHGVYSLSIAQAVGPSGRVWSYEPASVVAGFLAQSIAVNGFEHVVLERQAMSDHVGQAEMSVSADSELNTLALNGSPKASIETVELTTLDDAMARHSWHDIDFIKIDAEGEEARILEGGARFFAELSPLVLYEIREGSGLHLGLVESFTARGYNSYRLVPGLGVLVPYDPSVQLDDFVLNLFACKGDRASLLAERGLLVQTAAGVPGGWPDDGNPPAGPRPNAHEWRHRLTALPYGQRLALLWDRTIGAGQSAQVSDALALYWRSQDEALPPARRFAALQLSLELLKAAAEQPSGFLRHASLARVAADFGSRALAFATLVRLSDDLFQRRNVGPAEPFLAPSARFDHIVPGDALGNWVLAAALEARERLGSHSSYFAGPSGWQQLQTIQSLGFASDEMGRRLALVQQRFGMADAPKAVVT
jgi:FkbM family methyltransferase